MTSAAVSFKPVRHDGMVPEVISPHGQPLRHTRTLSTIEPEAGGDDAMVKNPALVRNAWGHAKREKRDRIFKIEGWRPSHRRQARWRMLLQAEGHTRHEQ